MKLLSLALLWDKERNFWQPWAGIVIGILLGLALLVGTVCVGQQPHVCPGPHGTVVDCGDAVPIPSTGSVAKPAPLKCGKYQRMVRSLTQSCKADPSDKTGMIAICEDSKPPYCVDDLHVVTEKEWQETTQRLFVLEHKHELLYNSYIELLTKLAKVGAKR